MTINTLEQDLAATAASNVFRVKNGMTRARNPYSWWKYMFVALTFYPNGTTVKSLLEDLASVGVTGINKTTVGLLVKVANQEERDPTSRNYAFNLPGLAQAAGLVIAGQQYSGKRPAYVFKFRNTTLARAIMLQTFPETSMFFALLDKKL